MQRKVRNSIACGKDVEEVVVGLEDAKRGWKLCVCVDEHTVAEPSMDADYAALYNYLRRAYPRSRITVGYEAGFAGFELHDRLEADGINCIVIPPNRVLSEKNSRRKNDRIDARKLAQMVASMLRKGNTGCHVPSRQLRRGRQLVRTLGQVQAHITATKNQIRRTLEFHGEEPFGLRMWQERQYRELESALEEAGVDGELLFSIQMLLQMLCDLRKVKANLVNRLRALAKTELYAKNVDLVRSVPGMGALTAIRLVLEWGDMRRFQRKESFVAFLGLDPSDYSTGGTLRLGHITKQGSRRVRSWLVEAAWRIVRRDAVMEQKYARVWRSSGSKKKAIVAVARKLALRLRAMLLTGTEYQVGLVH